MRDGFTDIQRTEIRPVRGGRRRIIVRNIDSVAGQIDLDATGAHGLDSEVERVLVAVITGHIHHSGARAHEGRIIGDREGGCRSRCQRGGRLACHGELDFSLVNADGIRAQGKCSIAIIGDGEGPRLAGSQIDGSEIRVIRRSSGYIAIRNVDGIAGNRNLRAGRTFAANGKGERILVRIIRGDGHRGIIDRTGRRIVGNLQIEASARRKRCRLTDHGEFGGIGTTQRHRRATRKGQRSGSGIRDHESPGLGTSRCADHPKVGAVIDVRRRRPACDRNAQPGHSDFRLCCDGGERNLVGSRIAVRVRVDDREAGQLNGQSARGLRRRIERKGIFSGHWSEIADHHIGDIQICQIKPGHSLRKTNGQGKSFPDTR